MKNLSQSEIESLDSTLFDEIEEFINDEIVNWGEMCECEEEGDAMEYVLASCSGGPYYEWRVLEDGTVDVIMHGSLELEWQDEDGEERVSKITDNFRGSVGESFDDECNNSLPRELAIRVMTEAFGIKEIPEENNGRTYENTGLRTYYLSDDALKAVDDAYSQVSKCPHCGAQMFKFCMCQR